MLKIILITGIVIRIALSNLFTSVDAASFPLWANYLASHSIGDLYSSLPGKYPPYLPGYYFLLKPMGWFSQAVNLESNIFFSYFFYKSPTYIADAISTLLIFSLTKKFYSKKAAIWGAAFFFLNPAIIFVGSIWGQIDSIIILFSLLFITFLLMKKVSLALLSLSMGSLIKFQQLAIAPILLLLPFIFKAEKVLRALLVSTLLMFMILSPVIFYKNPVWGLKYLFALPHQYPYLSVYAFNIWSPLGFIKSDTASVFLGLPFNLLALCMYGSISAFVVFKLFEAKKYFSKSLIFAALLLFYSFAFFSTRVHSRYFIYTIGLSAPFFYHNPKLIILLNIFVILNLVLPGDFSQLKTITNFLQSANVIILFTSIGFIIFIMLLANYLKLIKAK